MIVYQPKVCGLPPLVLHIRTRAHNHTMDLGINNCLLIRFKLCLISLWHLRLNKFWAEFYIRGMCIGKLPITLNWRTWNLTEAHELLPQLATKSLHTICAHAGHIFPVCAERTGTQTYRKSNFQMYSPCFSVKLEGFCNEMEESGARNAAASCQGLAGMPFRWNEGGKKSGSSSSSISELIQDTGSYLSKSTGIKSI